MTDDLLRQQIQREISEQADLLYKQAFERFLTDASFRQQVSEFAEALFTDAALKYDGEVVLGVSSVFRAGFNIIEKKIPPG